MLFPVIAAGSFCLCLAGAPWWLIAPLCAIAAFFFSKKTERPFRTGFAANGLVWTLILTGQLLTSNIILAQRTARFLGLPHWLVLVIITILIGAVLGGASAYAGKRIRADYDHYIIKKNNF